MRAYVLRWKFSQQIGANYGRRALYLSKHTAGYSNGSYVYTVAWCIKFGLFTVAPTHARFKDEMNIE